MDINPIFQSQASGDQTSSMGVNPIFQNNQSQTQSSPLGNIIDDSILSRAAKDSGDQSYNGLCEQFVEQQAYGKSGLFPTAADAWDSYASSGKAYADVTRAPSGSLIYFAPDSSNWGDGHVGIADGNGGFISATSNGVQRIPIEDWVKLTGQKPLGYVLP